MPRRPRVDWTDFEQAQVYAATVDLLKAKKIATPVEPGKNGALFMSVLREAQVVLPEKRRRPLANVDALPTSSPLAKRFVENQIIPKDYYQVYRRRANKKASPADEPQVDPRILELETLNQQYVEQITSLGQRLADAETKLHAYARQPTPMQLIQRFVADTLAMALIQVEDHKKPAGFRPPLEERRQPQEQMPLPEFERERRRDPMPTPGLPSDKPRIVVVGGSDKDYARIQNEVGRHADMRYIDTPAKINGSALKHLTSNGGRVVVWTDFASHTFNKSLEAANVQYHRHSGNLNSLVEYLKATILKLKGAPA